MKLPNFEIVTSTDDLLLIRDLGPWNQYPTITNAAEEVVDYLVAGGYLKDSQRLEYIDSDGVRDQILVDGGEFAGFWPKHRQF